MRDLLFKNNTSYEKRRKVLASTEIFDQQGLRNVIHRHFICLVREIAQGSENMPKLQTYLCVLKEHNSKEQRERFVCRIKGGMYVVSEGKMCLITFMHSLHIQIRSIPHNAMKY